MEVLQAQGAKDPRALALVATASLVLMGAATIATLSLLAPEVPTNLDTVGHQMEGFAKGLATLALGATGLMGSILLIVRIADTERTLAIKRLKAVIRLSKS